MKKLKLKLDGVKEMLSRDQMKKISGGYGVTCYFTVNEDCGGGFIPFQCNYHDVSYCQTIGDGLCSDNDCCDDFNC